MHGLSARGSGRAVLACPSPRCQDQPGAVAGSIPALRATTRSWTALRDDHRTNDPHEQ